MGCSEMVKDCCVSFLWAGMFSFLGCGKFRVGCDWIVTSGSSASAAAVNGQL